MLQDIVPDSGRTDISMIDNARYRDIGATRSSRLKRNNIRRVNGAGSGRVVSREEGGSFDASFLVGVDVGSRNMRRTVWQLGERSE